MNNDLEILKHKLQTLLRDNIMEISFTKVDGTLREMKCTLKDTILPETSVKEKWETDRLVSENTIAVWDVENNGWRSFRVDSVHDYITLKNEV